MTPLQVLHERITARTEAIVDSCGTWPCNAGCDGCCRSLADVPRMTEPEWDLLREAISALPEEARSGVLGRAGALVVSKRPIVCPLLNQESGWCLVYDARPVACRTYGFYRERDQGLYCGMIRDRVDSGELEHVVWGNQATISRAQEDLGPERDLLSWLRFRLGNTSLNGIVGG